jgi:hypothetical protein
VWLTGWPQPWIISQSFWRNVNLLIGADSK